MKTMIIIITVVAVLVFVYTTNSAKAVITDVVITPDEPTMVDIITIETFGEEGSGPVEVLYSEVNITDPEVELDIFLYAGPFAVITGWSYSEDIGILPVGTYDLTVRAYVNLDFTHTYFTTFQVIPEPATLALLGLGALAILRRRK